MYNTDTIEATQCWRHRPPYESHVKTIIQTAESLTCLGKICAKRLRDHNVAVFDAVRAGIPSLILHRCITLAGTPTCWVIIKIEPYNHKWRTPSIARVVLPEFVGQNPLSLDLFDAPISIGSFLGTSEEGGILAIEARVGDVLYLWHRKPNAGQWRVVERDAWPSQISQDEAKSLLTDDTRGGRRD